VNARLTALVRAVERDANRRYWPGETLLAELQGAAGNPADATA
jgi:hypothetical protein